MIFICWVSCEECHQWAFSQDQEHPFAGDYKSWEPPKSWPNKMQVPNAQLFILAVVVVALVRGHAVEQEHLTSHGAYE